MTDNTVKVAEELSDVLDKHDLSLEDALLVLTYLLADTLRQSTDEVPVYSVALDTAKELVGLYMLMCRMGANSDNIVVQ